MVNIAIHDKYLPMLQAFGNIQETIERAIQRYAVVTITETIADLRQREHTYRTQYGMDYPSFEKRIAEDQAFVDQIEHHVTATWELDFADWEFCYKGIQDWTHKLETILLT